MSRSLAQTDPYDSRPDFMARLGLLPPYAEQDVKQAYLEKVKSAHPDRGGDAAAFQQIHRAFEQALEYVRFRSNRRDWISQQLEAYVEMREVISRLTDQYGAVVSVEAVDWMKESFGDFAQLVDKVVGIRLVDSSEADAMIDDMIRHQPALRYLRRLELPGCRVSDEAVLHLRAFTVLRHLDLSGTPVTARVAKLARRLESLSDLNLQGTGAGWWTRLRLKPLLARRRRRQQSTESLSQAVRDRMRRRKEIG